MSDSEKTASNSPGKDEEESIEDIINKLDEHNITADRQIGEDASDENESVENSNGENKLTPQNGEEKDVSNGHDAKNDKDKDSDTKTDDKGVDRSDSDKKIKNPFRFLKRLSSGNTKDKAEKEKEERLKRKQKLEKILNNVKVETLPQTFVTKYLGNQPSKGLYGIKFTREPVETLVNDISNSKKTTDLPLFSVQVSTRGLLINPHKANKSSDIPIDMGLLPIEFISYGVQDIKYTRIFSYIVVREMSSKSKTLECHALLCDSVVTARKLALSMALAFKEYARTLQGKPYKFKVDLRAPAEVEKDLEKEPEEGEDCEA